jgi:hypothetical protein
MEKPTMGPSAKNLATLALKAGSPSGFGISLAPVLPSAWPPRDKFLVWLAYRTEPLPTGAIASRILGPVSQVQIELPEGSPTVLQFDSIPSLGRDRDAGPAPEMTIAEQALVDVITGRRDAESARGELASYLAWVKAKPVIGADMRKRFPEFFTWLEADKQ